MFDAWERYKYLLRLFLFHGLEKWMIIHAFYNDLLYATRMTLDTAYGGALINSPQHVAYNLIEEMTQNHHSWGSMRQVSSKSTPKTSGLYEVNVFDHMNDKVDSFYQKIDSLSITHSIPILLLLLLMFPPPLSTVRYIKLMGTPVKISK